MTKVIGTVGLFLLGAVTASAQDVTPLLTKIKSVGKEGAGNVEAIKAFKELTKRGPEVLIDILTAFDDANPVAANWLRSAVASIADRTLNAGKKLSAEKLERFINDTDRSGAARYLAYEYLARIDPEASRRLLPRMFDDPGAELRRAAIAWRIDRIDLATGAIAVDELLPVYRALLKYAVDRDQVIEIAKRLKNLNVEVELTKHFGFITQWTLVGPFDSTGGKGFHTVFGPEKKVDLTTEYEGKGAKKIRWFKHETKAEFGVVDFNKEIGQLKGAAAFAFTAVHSETERPVDLRVGSNNAVRIYLNGKEMFFREEYHHGMRMDQYIAKGTLRAGRNEILIKVCQNEQTEEWAQLWSFQLRVCDAIGGAVPVTVKTNSEKRQ